MSRVAGALVGLAAGDVLGAGFEGVPRQVMASRVGDRVEAPVPGSLYSDDTQQALVLAYHLLTHGEIRPTALAEELASLGSLYRGEGPGFRAFLRARAARRPPEEAAQPSAGNGAAMRVAPVAVRFSADRERLVAQSVAASLLTHRDPRGVAAAAALAGGVASAGRGEEGRGLLREALETAVEAEHLLFERHSARLGPSDHWHSFSEALRESLELLGLPPVRVAQEVGARAAGTSATGLAAGTDAYALASVITALVVGAQGEADPYETVRRAVALGGDADTVGAMVGAMAGARAGPAEPPWPVPNQDLLLEVGERLATGVLGREGLPELAAAEAALRHGG